MRETSTVFVGFALCIQLAFVACASPYKVAEELSDAGQSRVVDSTADSDNDAYRDAGQSTDLSSDDPCLATGEGDQPCVEVMACENGCEGDETCLQSCQESLCPEHVEAYCAMTHCVATACTPLCEVLTSEDCLCAEIYCTVTRAACLAANTCEEN